MVTVETGPGEYTRVSDETASKLIEFALSLFDSAEGYDDDELWNAIGSLEDEFKLRLNRG